MAAIESVGLWPGREDWKKIMVDWISVDDELPNSIDRDEFNDEDVIPKYYPVLIDFYPAWFKGTYIDGAWQFKPSSPFSLPVTHWMQMPKHPGGK